MHLGIVTVLQQCTLHNSLIAKLSTIFTDIMSVQLAIANSTVLCIPVSSIPGYITFFLHPSWQAKLTSWGVLRLFWITCVCVCVCVCVCIYLYL